MIHTEVAEPTETPMGAVTFVGFGPGDPGLITYAGSREVVQADLLVVDSPVMVEELASVGIEPLGEVVEAERRGGPDGHCRRWRPFRGSAGRG